MSDPIGDSEVEDVLASVRRLVSHQREAQPAEQSVKGSPAGKLFLAPSLRVHDDEARDTGGTDTAAPDQRAEPPRGSAVAETRWDVKEAPSSSSLRRSDHTSLEQTIAELEAAVAASQQDWDPDGTEAGPDDVMEQRASTGVQGGEPPAEEAAPSHPASENADDGAESNVRDLTARREQYAGAGPSGDAERPGDGAVDLFEDEDVILDEAMLRDLIAQIVREELQGTLGERITRNVRKLVRSEIARALASRDLDDHP